jgi:hypothetical protein
VAGFAAEAGAANAGEDRGDDVVAEGDDTGDDAVGIVGHVVATVAARLVDESFAAELA